VGGYNAHPNEVIVTRGQGGRAMDVVESILRAGLMIVFLVVVIIAVAALFMIVFGIATGIDDKLQS
jgi:hypothetical protein